MNEDKMRERFEAWARRSGRTDTQLRIGSNGEYAILGTQWEWMAWQAATRAAVPAWQPIETAPKDGTVVLARIPDHDVQQAVMWSAKDQCWAIQWDHWNLRGLDAPTHWMHLPEVE